MEKKFFRITAGYTLFDKKKIGKFESRASWRETTTIQNILATKCNKNEQQHDSKNYAEL
jgi:hypothetical protein